MNKWIDRAESRFGHLGIPGLIRYIAAFNALCFVLAQANPKFVELLMFNRDLVLQGEVWRLFTYVFIPHFGGLFPSWFAAAIYIIFLIFIGDGLERAMGPFRLTLFYLLGMLGTTIAGFLSNADPSGFFINASLLFAFAHFFGDNIIYLFFILPVKVKWLAWISAAFIMLGFVGGPWIYKLSVIAALGNYFIFFGRDLIHQAQHRREVSQRRARFEAAAKIEDDEPLHRCTVCSRTDQTDPDLEFRVAKDGEEYCREHLPKAPAAE